MDFYSTMKVQLSNYKCPRKMLIFGFYFFAHMLAEGRANG